MACSKIVREHGGFELIVAVIATLNKLVAIVATICCEIQHGKLRHPYVVFLGSLAEGGRHDDHSNS
jgi:hypothetical protein